MTDVASLPPGFVLDEPQGGSNLPAGFTLDSAHPLSWSDVASQAWQNAPASGARFAEDIAQPFIHPIDTAKSLKNLGEGVLEKSGLMSGHDEEKFADAFGGYFKNRYGSVQGFKHAVASDPVGVLGDLSTVLTLGGGAAARAPGLIGKAGEIVADVGDSVNPVMSATKAAGRVAGRFGKAEDAAASAVPSTEDLYTAADEAYSHPAIKELVVKPSAVRTWRDETRSSLDGDGFTAELAPRTHGVLKHIDKLAANGPITGTKLDTVRKMLNRAASVPDPTEQAAASRVKGALDDFVEQAPEDAILRGDPKKVADVLADARGNYAAAKRSDTVEGRLDRAELNAQSANSGQNIDNAIRQQIKAILISPKLSRGYSKDELAQMRRVVAGKFTGDAARFISNVLGKGGGFPALVAGVEGAKAGFALGGPWGGMVGAAGPAVGYAFSKLSNRITGQEVSKLQELVRSRSPLAAQLEAPLKKWAEADVAHRASPSARTLARLTLASRNLSHNLADAGLRVAPNALVDSGSGQGNQTSASVQ